MNELLAALGALVVACIPLVRKYIQHRITPDQLERVSDIANGAVRAAEEIAQHFKLPSGAGATADDYASAAWTAFATWGQAKEAYASEVIAHGAKRLGVKLTPAEVSAFLHAALRKMEQMAAQEAAESA